MLLSQSLSLVVSRLTITLICSLAITACGGGGGGSAPTLVSPQAPVDSTPPAIALEGDAEMVVEQGEGFSDPGATATDEVDGTVSVSVSGAVDTNTAGSYTLTYSASDAAGNEASVERVVIVEDTTSPTITLNGESAITIVEGDGYTELGASASDNIDGALTVIIAGSVESVPGVYIVSYTATDTAGNAVSVDRTVTVEAAQTGGEDGGSTGGDGSGDGGSGGGGTPADTTPPVVSLSGASALTVEQGTSFTDPGASAQDDVDGAVQVTVAGLVDVNTAGTYTLTYTATDSAGNVASLDRTVTVADTTAPVVTLIGSGSITLDTDATYTESGANATDSVDGVLTVTITGSVGSAAGEYRITYSATDDAGNTGSVQRIVTVQDADVPSDDVPLSVLSQGVVDGLWDRGIGVYDAVPNSDCMNDGGAGCPSIAWSQVDDSERGTVLEVEHSSSGAFALLFIAATNGQDLTKYATGSLEFDIKVISGDAKFTVKLDCVYSTGCFSADQPLGERGASGWDSVKIPMAQFRSAGLDITKVDTGIVIWATDTKSTIYRLDNVRFTGFDADADDSTTPPVVTVPFNLTEMGLGSYSDTINPASYKCADDNGAWLYNAGVIPFTNIGTCNTVEQARPVKRMPQLAGDAEKTHTMTHRWWGSVSFIGEMRIGDPGGAGYITPDPFIARLSERGLRVMGIPTGLSAGPSGFGYTIPDPFAEIFDGAAIGNSAHSNMEAKLLDYSEGAITAGWYDGTVLVMEATFVYGSPYIFFEVHSGSPQIKTWSNANSGQRGIWHQSGASLGVWTAIAGGRNNFLVVGDAGTTFSNTDSPTVTISAPSGSFTLAWAPDDSVSVRQTLETYARNVVRDVTIDYSVDRSDNSVTVSHRYLDEAGSEIETLAGLMPLHWKRAAGLTYATSARSARGLIKFAPTSAFDYELPSVGVLPSLPIIDGSLNETTLRGLVSDFVEGGASYWNTANDTYWNGKAVGRLSEVLALADQLGMTSEANTLRDWLKTELADWMSAVNQDTLDSGNYFVYDEDWSTLLGMEESFYSHTLLQDHHFHYGYFVRAAAEVCRVEKEFCSAEQYGPMFELLIRDYAGGRDDPMFPYLRNFDPANGFSWASGEVNFARGNNNESTSEAANAYGAMVLYGLATGNDQITERGMYLHASTSATYWEYWNDIDGWRGGDPEARNFPPGYPRITTSIIWGEGSAFSTWFSPRFAHILGIQGLPSNPLIMHVGLYADYLDDYVTLGLEESANGKPSGLPPGEWTDLWWNLWAMTDANAAIADYEATSSYEAEAGEAPAHTYQWIYTMRALGELQTGTGAITANHPAAMVFETEAGVTSYVVYNYNNEAINVTFSDGTIIEAPANQFSVERY